MLGVRCEARVVDRSHLWVRREECCENLRIRAGPLHAQRERLGPGGDVVCVGGRKRAAPVAQPLLADLIVSPIAEPLQ